MARFTIQHYCDEARKSFQATQRSGSAGHAHQHQHRRILAKCVRGWGVSDVLFKGQALARTLDVVSRQITHAIFSLPTFSWSSIDDSRYHVFNLLVVAAQWAMAQDGMPKELRDTINKHLIGEWNAVTE